MTDHAVTTEVSAYRRGNTGSRSRDKDARAQRAIVRLLQRQGTGATKISRVAGADLRLRILGIDRAVELKCRAAGFRKLYDWLSEKPIGKQPLVVVRMSQAAEIAEDRNKGTNEGGAI